MFQRALIVREKALGPDHPDVAVSLDGLAKLYSQRGNFDKAEPLYQRALKILERALGPNHPGVSELLTNMAAFYAASGNTELAIAAQARANAILERNIALNLATGSERQKLAFMTTVSEITDRTVSLNASIAPGNREARRLAVTTILQRKGLVQDATSDGLAALRRRFNAQDQKLLDQLNDTTGRLARLVLNGPQKISLAEHQQQIGALEEQKEQTENEISRRSAGFYTRAVRVTLAAVQAAIPAHAALIEIFAYRPFDPKAGEVDRKAFGAPHYVAYVLRHDGEVQSKELGLTKPVDEAIDALRQALRDPKRTDVKLLARVVDEKVMEPVGALVGDATQLLVSTDGALNLIPFEALVDEQGRYLIERYAFTYLTSGRDLLRMQVAREGSGMTTIVANPSFGEPVTAQIARANIRGRLSPPGRRRSVTAARTLSEVYFAPLRGTGQEALTIQTLFPEANLLTGERATESELKKIAEPRILHVATHGFFLQDAASAAADKAATRGISADSVIENPLLRSGLALTGANRRSSGVKDDGILTALEASGLNLWGTKLVVLSACDTGLGEVRNGEGVYGLRRAFVLAGAESLVMSLWPVSDYSTRNLMISYYRNLKLGMGRGAGLRQVQLDLLKRNRLLHPFYWANFIQFGEWANLNGKR
jgi:CHAT domain-containing protein